MRFLFLEISAAHPKLATCVEERVHAIHVQLTASVLERYDGHFDDLYTDDAAPSQSNAAYATVLDSCFC
jgi:hypothetical protein